MMQPTWKFSTAALTLATACLVCWAGPPTVWGQEPGGAADKATEEFSRQTIDLGVVVRDVERSVKFYTEAFGFQEQPGFSVPGEFAADAGLTDGRPLDIRVLTLGDQDTATRLKLMALPDAQPRASDNRFIHSQLGVSYLTVFVTDTSTALERLKKAGVKPVAKGPVPLPKGLPQGVFLTVVRDPDGNLIELVGPRSED